MIDCGLSDTVVIKRNIVTRNIIAMFLMVVSCMAALPTHALSRGSVGAETIDLVNEEKRKSPSGQ
jgi:hypothetical protein